MLDQRIQLLDEEISKQDEKTHQLLHKATEYDKGYLLTTDDFTEVEVSNTMWNTASNDFSVAKTLIISCNFVKAIVEKSYLQWQEGDEYKNQQKQHTNNLQELKLQIERLEGGAGELFPQVVIDRNNEIAVLVKWP